MIHFDTPVAPGLLFTDDELKSDLDTIQTMLAADLGPGGNLRSEPAAKHRATSYMHFVRWRLFHGFFRNSDLTPEVLDRLKEDLRTRGVAQVVPFAGRLVEYMLEIDLGALPLPVLTAKGRSKLDMREVMFRIGCGHTVHLDAEALQQIEKLSNMLGVQAGISLQAKPKTKSDLAYAAFLGNLPRLWQHRSLLQHDLIGFLPFGGETQMAVARGFAGRTTGRTSTIESQSVCGLIDQALTWVLDYGEPLLEFKAKLDDELKQLAGTHTSTIFPRAIKRVLSTFEFPETKGSAPWPLKPLYLPGPKTTNDRPSVARALFQLLPASCMIVIAAFSARRANEILSLKRGCCEARAESHYLHTYIQKNLRDVDVIPVPASVYKAVSILERLIGDDARFLFDFKGALANKPSKMAIGFVMRNALPAFADFIGGLVLLDGKPWRPKPHQFRRFFAILYFNRFRFGQLTALSNFLRHDNLEVTRRYVTEPHRGIFFEDGIGHRARDDAERRHQDFLAVEHEFKVERLVGALVDGEMMGGWGGQAIKRRYESMKEDLLARVEFVGSDEDVEKSLSTLIDAIAADIKLEPNSSGHGYCKATNRPEDRAVAVCLRQAAQDGADPDKLPVPVAAFSSDMACSSCPSHVQFAENKSYWDRMLAEINGRRNTAIPEIMRGHIDHREETISANIERWYGDIH